VFCEHNAADLRASWSRIVTIMQPKGGIVSIMQRICKRVEVEL